MTKVAKTVRGCGRQSSVATRVRVVGSSRPGRTSWNHPRPTMLSVSVFGAKTPAIAWLPRGALRELRDALNRILGDVAIKNDEYATLARLVSSNASFRATKLRKVRP
jgi:hypothetical protein